MKYRVHRFDMGMRRDQLEDFLNGLKGEVISVVPNVTVGFLWIPRVDFLLVVEKVGSVDRDCGDRSKPDLDDR
jgi:hypothetical protein